ncbi:hypothetical protein V5O48_003288 [Marasmius crinis-equi]|uniref:Rhomboid-type serine protease n=1 Tax=Marasmius crinis-equi TaxID=585013 RepID=A0ABR3FTC7_9AGAR
MTTTTKHAPPEDDAFDHRSIISDTSTHKNLVRGASTSNRSTSKGAAGGYSDNLSYIDEEPRSHPKEEHSQASLVGNAADMGRSSHYQDLEYADPYKDQRAPLVQDAPNAFASSRFGQFMAKGKYPIEQRIEDKKRGIGRQKYPFVVWAFSAVMVAVIIYELIVNWKAQGTPLSFKPVTNVMLGPSWSALINVGGRFPPCMKLVADAPPNALVPCLNATSNPPEQNQLCTIETVCGFGGFDGKEPNQWWRFITPVFLHAGIIHIVLNLFAQLTISAQIEREMGSGGFLVTYMAAGIFGNILGGNFSLVGAPSTGASGAIFGTLAVLWVDLFSHWKYHYRPVRKLIFMIIDLAVGIAIGFIPFVDNFAHLGGLFMGLLVGMVFYPIISETKRHKTIVWALRIAAIPIAIIMFVILTRNFYTSDPYAGSREIIFVGDSIARQLFFQLSNLLDPNLPTSPVDDRRKHENYTLHTRFGSKVSFYWDPFLNSTYTREIFTASQSRPSILVFNTGLWYLRHSDTFPHGGLAAWEANIEGILDTISSSRKPADTTVLLPVGRIDPDKLSPDRKATMHPADIDAMNSDLMHRLANSSSGVVFLGTLNEMFHRDDTVNGLHLVERAVRVQANLLLNLHCNERLSERVPFDGTCCRRYPEPLFLQVFVVAGLLLFGLYKFLYPTGGNVEKVQSEASFTVKNPLLVLSVALILSYLGDRSPLWLKERKSFSPWTFSFLVSTSLTAGLATLQRSEKQSGFLNRHQTDEWKGWMQCASKIPGIYNPVRVLVASYLFMTGYGHTSYYLSKGDYSFLRVARVLVRLNLFTVLILYTTDTNYILYYFTPLVSLWFVIVYATLAVAPQWNNNLPFLSLKILTSAGTMFIFLHESWPLEALFNFLQKIFHIHWSAREWAFRMKLDLWVVYHGMFTAIAVTKIRERRLVDSPRLVKAAVGASILTLAWFMWFEVRQESKYTYNATHPYISVLPIMAYVILRNASEALRSTYSRAFAFVGRCSLETFVIQYHLWLAADSKGLLVVLGGAIPRAFNFIVTTTILIYLSHQVSRATAVVVAAICNEGGTEALLPAMHIRLPSVSHDDYEAMACKPTSRSRTRLRLGGMVDQPKLILLVLLSAMWTLNMMWGH